MRARDVSGPVDERVLHVAADLGARIRDERDAAAAQRFAAHERGAFLQARQHEDVAGRIRSATSSRWPRTWTLGCASRSGEPLVVGRDESAGDEEASLLGRGRRSHASSAKMQALADGRDADEEHRQARRSGRTAGGKKPMDRSRRCGATAFPAESPGRRNVCTTKSDGQSS